MKALRVSFLAVALVALSQLVATGNHNPNYPDPPDQTCIVSGDPPRLGPTSAGKPPRVTFEYLTDSGTSDGIYYYYHRVRNTHRSNPLRVKWEKIGWYHDGLGPEEDDGPPCLPDGNRHNTLRSEIKYGGDLQYPVKNVPYYWPAPGATAPQALPAPGRTPGVTPASTFALVSAIRTKVFAEAGEVIPIAIVFRSAIMSQSPPQAAPTRTVSYEVINEKDSSFVIVEWRSVVGPIFGEFASRRAGDFYRNGLFLLNPSNAVQFNVESTRTPHRVFQLALIYKDRLRKKLLYSALVPAYAFDTIEPFEGKF